MNFKKSETIKVAIGCRANYPNPIIKQFLDAYEENPKVSEVAIGHDIFWGNEHERFDILHIHWPEELLDWKETPTQQDLENFENKLRQWKKHARIFITIHNIYPHRGNNEAAKKLYQLAYTYADGAIHGGNESIKILKDLHGHIPNLVHRVIPMPVNNSFANTITDDEARQKLNFRQEDVVFLSLGNIRHYEELNTMLKAFERIKVTNKKLIIAEVPRKRTITLSIRKIIKRISLANNPNIIFHWKFIPSDEVQVFVNASDVIIISRLNTLNSAGTLLGFGFGKVTVGPDIGVIGETLTQTGNPVFIPHNIPSFTKALEVSATLAQSGLGASNKKYGETHWKSEHIISQHINFFFEML